MQLETYISDLLYRYDCVTIPNFGAFLTEHVSAKIDEISQKVYPPKKVLSFNQQISHNDGLLANYIAETEKIPYTTVIGHIEKHVKRMKAYLLEGETIHFKHIGDLVLNTESNIVFQPEHQINYLTDAFGLSQLTSHKVLRVQHTQAVENIEEKAPIILTNEKRSYWKRYAVAAVFILGFSSLGFYAYQNNNIRKHNSLAEQEAAIKLEKKIQEATFVIPNPLPDVTLTVTKPKGNFHVIAGAFRVKENAEKKVKQLRKSGFEKARIVRLNRYKLYEVVYSSYKTRKQAQRALYNIQDWHNEDAWLLVKKLN
jgi:nucleoid DNA-binding protein